MSTDAKKYTISEVIESLDEAIMSSDNEGQIVLYTGFYRWQDGTIRDQPEVKDDDRVL